MNKLLIIVGIAIAAFAAYSLWPNQVEQGREIIDDGGIKLEPHPLSIEAMRQGEYPGSDLVVEQTLPPCSNYSRSIVSYKSDGLKIYALLTIPYGPKPKAGWPVIVFNHGFIPPAQYSTTERYLAYTDAFSRNGYMLIRPDYRGHGNSEGQPAGGYGTNAYTIDVLNAVSSIKRHPDADPERIGMWGHSMGGHITLRSMVVSRDIKAGVIWGGVVASYDDLLNNWRRRNLSATPSILPGNTSRSWRTNLVREFGEPEKNPAFWNSISATSYLTDISGPLQLHHGEADHSVPPAFSIQLHDLMQKAGQTSELYTYPRDDHDISNNLSLALSRSVAFFDKYLK